MDPPLFRATSMHNTSRSLSFASRLINALHTIGCITLWSSPNAHYSHNMPIEWPEPEEVEAPETTGAFLLQDLDKIDEWAKNQPPGVFCPFDTSK
ncbi:hypothetical protein COCOBI_13-3060 [Coccomyxa sp. Obi]|nr:hypothetical protein COCOBI_13-3060 [Coccomyxa sp. Obi]